MQVFEFGNGDVYKGEFLDDDIQGDGTRTYADGGRYLGSFKVAHAPPPQRSCSACCCPSVHVAGYATEFLLCSHDVQGGLRHGHGSMQWPDGRVYARPFPRAFSRTSIRALFT